jgi:F0F1-type ATP synthase membrane subunit b/b'
MESLQIIEQILNEIAEARSVPLSRDGALVNRQEMINLLNELKKKLPEDILQANHLLDNKEAVMEEGRMAGQVVIEQARAEANRLISQTEIVQSATQRAQEILKQVDQELNSMRNETDEYIDARLANFEITLNRTLLAVRRGRERVNQKKLTLLLNYLTH